MSLPVDMTIIIAECNFLEQALEEMYIGKEEFTITMRREIHNRLSQIRRIANYHRLTVTPTSDMKT